MSESEIGRIKGDLAAMQRALGFHVSFGKGMLAFGTLLTLSAIGAGVIGLLSDNSWLQVTPFAALTVLCLFGLYLQSLRIGDLSHEIKLQVAFAVTVYFAVVGATCGYVLAAVCGPSIGTARTVALYASSLAFVLPFSFILVLNALKSRERHYCLGLALSLLLTGLVVPIVDPRFSFPLAHGFMAIGYLSGVGIQWFQLREATPNEAH